MRKPKTLEWSEEREPCDACGYHHIVAESALGQFSIEWKGWKEHDSRTVYIAGEYIDSAESLECAKLVAAQHIYKIVLALIDADTLEQSQPEQPAITMHRVAQYKLDALLSEGYTVNGYAIERHNATGTVTRGFITNGGMVCWWSDRDNDPMSHIPDAGKVVTKPLSSPEQPPFGYFRAEPFGWTDCAETDEGAKALYESPPSREWVGLTDEEVDLTSAKFFPQDLLAFHSGMYVAQNILKERNHGV